jgi:hypothetical protein
MEKQKTWILIHPDKRESIMNYDPEEKSKGMVKIEDVEKMIDERLRGFMKNRNTFLKWDFSIGSLSKEDVYRNLIELEWGIQEFKELKQSLKELGEKE